MSYLFTSCATNPRKNKNKNKSFMSWPCIEIARTHIRRHLNQRMNEHTQHNPIWIKRLIEIDLRHGITKFWLFMKKSQWERAAAAAAADTAKAVCVCIGRFECVLVLLPSHAIQSECMRCREACARAPITRSLSTIPHIVNSCGFPYASDTKNSAMCVACVYCCSHVFSHKSSVCISVRQSRHLASANLSKRQFGTSGLWLHCCIWNR